MPILDCRPAIRKVLREAVRRSRSGDLTIGTAQDLLNPFDYTTLPYRLGEYLARLYLEALNILRWELHPQHAEDIAVVEGFWGLFTDVLSDSAKFTNRTNLDKRIEEFGRELKRPLSDYDVAYAIEFMDVGRDSLSIGSIKFVGPHDKTQSNWAKDSSWWPKDKSRTDSISIAYISTAGADHSRAREAGIQQVYDALDVLRVAALRGRSGDGDIDELLQWRVTGHWAARSRNNPTSRVTGWHRSFSPSVIDLSSAIQTGLNAVPLANIASGTLPADIHQRLLRAVRWISGSVVHEDHDHKIVDLCTALEVMLLPNYRHGGKGELIALRYHLLGGDLNPAGMLRFYEWRSGIVHGTSTRAIGLSDTWLLRLEVGTVLRRILEITKQTPEVETLEELIVARETREKLEELIFRCDERIYKGTGIAKIKAAAKTRLSQIAGIGASVKH